MTNTAASLPYRRQYREEVLPRRYCGWCHVALVALAGAFGIALALWIATPTLQSRDLWVVPVTVLVANAVEYLAHRGPMHHRRKGLTALHTRHTGRHHRYFVVEAMHFESARDFHAVLFPPVLLLFFGGIAASLGLLASLVLPKAVAALFVATALAYYLLYELLHFLYHVPPGWRAGQWPVVRTLSRLHRLHHDPRLMQRRNFNLVFPLCDWLAGTLDTRDPQHAQHPIHRHHHREDDGRDTQPL